MSALERQQRVRKNSVHPERLKRVATELNTALDRSEEHNAAGAEYLAHPREPKWPPERRQ